MTVRPSFCLMKNNIRIATYTLCTHSHTCTLRMKAKANTSIMKSKSRAFVVFVGRGSRIAGAAYCMGNCAKKRSLIVFILSRELCP